MPRRCTICDHPRRAEIDRALLRNEDGYRSIAKRFAISESALFRHRQGHLADVVAKGLEAELKPDSGTVEPSHAMDLAREHRSLEARSAEQAIDAVAQLKAINAACLEVLKQARADGQPAILLKAVDRIARQIELQARLLGQIQEGHTINVAVLPEWHGIRQRILAALHPFPDARLAVVRALQGDSTP
jgi:transposase-like protein